MNVALFRPLKMGWKSTNLNKLRLENNILKKKKKNFAHILNKALQNTGFQYHLKNLDSIVFLPKAMQFERRNQLHSRKIDYNVV